MNTTLQRVIRFSVITIATIVSLLLFVSLIKYIYPFLLAFIIALFMNPLVALFIRKWKTPRALAVILAMFVFFAVFAGVITLILFQVVAGAGFLLKILPGYFEQFANSSIVFFNDKIIPFFEKATNWFENFENSHQNSLVDSLNKINSEATNWIVSILKSIVENIPSIFSWLPNAAIGILFTFLAVFFISKQWNTLYKFAESNMSESFFLPFRRVVSDVKRAVIGFFRAQLILLSITAVIASIGFMIIGIDYPITLGILVGLGEMIPYIGISSIFIPWITFAFITSNTSLGVSLIIIFSIIITQRMVIEPKILSKNMGLDPLATLFVMFVGLKLMGVVGVLLGTVVLVIITTLFNNGVFRDIRNYILK